MKTKRILWLFHCLWVTLSLSAQALSDEGRISLNAVVPEGTIPAEACRNLENKLVRAIATKGFADNGYTNRFVVTAKADITSKDIVASTPPRVSQKMEISFMVGDVIENKIYSTCVLPLTGIGTNENKAFISAFSKVNSNQKELQDMLDDAKAKIVSYYTTHCDKIITDAQALAGMQRYNEAIFHLMSVPDVCADCYQKCRITSVNIYKQKINTEGNSLLNQAKNIWMKQPDITGAEEVAKIICKINPEAQSYNEVIAFRNEIGSKLEAAAKQKWDLQMKQYDDNQAFKQSIVEACKAIGVAFGNGQPKSVTKTIVQRWL